MVDTRQRKQRGICFCFSDSIYRQFPRCFYITLLFRAFFPSQKKHLTRIWARVSKDIIAKDDFPLTSGNGNGIFVPLVLKSRILPTKKNIVTGGAQEYFLLMWDLLIFVTEVST